MQHVHRCCWAARVLPIFLVVLLVPTPLLPAIGTVHSAAAGEGWYADVIESSITAAETVIKKFPSDMVTWTQNLDLLFEDVAGMVKGTSVKAPELQLPLVKAAVAAVQNVLKQGAEGLEKKEWTAAELAPVVDAVVALPLDNHLSYVIVRRMVMALVVKLHLGKSILTPEAQSSVLTLCRKLQRLHKTSAQSKGVIEFFHISKSGGTTMCTLGSGNGCR